ncbi:uncharacterized protein LOC124173959 [Ischnura elegans]|uniref:uncharacterized protein LOC124173959 n=1 Tax=Ischnura elegans TaxID=197161 RepID=UPI001ED89F4A|nr:uncharacterized protein LOC124173959 [Ischnura elegans]
MPNCSACVKSIKREQKSLSCCECKAHYHPLCLSIPEVEIKELSDKRRPWYCDVCRAKIGCGSDGEQIRKAPENESASSSLSPDRVSDILKDFSANLADIRSDQSEIRKSISRWEESFGGQAKSLELLNASLVKITDSLNHLLSENISLKKQLSDTEARLNRVEQEQLRNVIEIHGIPYSEGEVAGVLICQVGIAVGIKVDTSEIDYAYRGGSNRSATSHPSPRPAPIIVRFLRSSTAAAFLNGRRTKRNLKLNDIVADQNPTNPPVYINESLTSLNRKLYAMARGLKKEGKIKYVWIRNGRVFARVHDGGERLSILVETDLDCLK